jgi:hypothetical protein
MNVFELPAHAKFAMDQWDRRKLVNRETDVEEGMFRDEVV